MPGSYTLELELFATYSVAMPVLEVYEDGALANSYSISSSGTSVSLVINYGGALPTSLQFTFLNDGAEAGRIIDLRSVKIDGKSVDINNYLSTAQLSSGNSSTVDVTTASYFFGTETPPAGSFTTGATQTYDGTNNLYNDYTNNTDQVFDMLGGRDVAYLGGGNDSVSGGAGDDILRGGAGTDLLFGDSGNDRIYGGDDADEIYGGDNDDLVHGGEGNDLLFGNAGVDTLVGHNGDDTLVGGAGDDRLNGGAGTDILYGGADNDRLAGGGGDDSLDGESGDDNIYGGAGNDIAHGGDGTDIIYGQAGQDILHGDDGDDDLFGGTDDDELYGGAGADFLEGDEGDDTLDGGADNDILKGGAGADTLNGGDGNDILHGHSINGRDIYTILQANPNVVYNADTNSFYEYVATGTQRNTALTNANGSVLNGLTGNLVTVTTASENTFVQSLLNAGATAWMSGSGTGDNDAWYWNGGAEDRAQWALGSSAVNNFYENWLAGEPNDTSGSVVYSRIREPAGDWTDRPNTDTLHYIIEWDAGLMSDDNASDTLSGGDGNDTLYGYGGNDTLTGGLDNDILFGGAGNDRLLGNDGNDAIYGGAGNDLIVGGTGVDTIDGGDGNDTIVGIEGQIIDITTLNSYGGGQDVGGTVTFEGNGVTLDGNLWKKFDLDYTVTANTVIEFDFRSTFEPEIAGIGFDTDNNISSNRTFKVYGTQNWGITNFDNYDGSGNWTHYKIEVGTFYTGFFDHLVLANDDDSGPTGNSSWANIIIYEDDDTDTSADILIGGGGDDSVSGNNGNNTLYGGDGLDTLIGYDGADTFVFENANAFNDIDIVADFDTTENDALDLRDLLTGYTFGVDTITDFVQILDNGANSDVYVDTGGTATFGAATQIATLTGVTGLTDEALLETNGHLITN